jgi:DTW domain-containing protein YfiP
VNARATCGRCRRPQSVCWCAHLQQLPTRTRVLVLQHPKEQHMAIGTARMAHLQLPSSELRVGLDFSRDPIVSGALQSGEPVYVVFPDATAIDAAEVPRDRPITLVVIDGTWWQAQKLLKLNPQIRALPHVAFSPKQKSQYKIRRQPADHCVSTVEALAEVLSVLEPDRGPFDRLLDPFFAMVARQETFIADVGSSRHRALHANRVAKPRPTLAETLGVDWSRLVCIAGDANAWPIHHPDKTPPEIVCWTAHRPATGETYAQVIAPRGRLAPSTPSHLELPRATIEGGVDVTTWRTTWADFLRADDVVVQWGGFSGKLAFDADLPRPPRGIDLRSLALQHLRRPVGTVEECLAIVGAETPELLAIGRAGRRLAALVAVLKTLWTMPRRPLAKQR